MKLYEQCLGYYVCSAVQLSGFFLGLMGAARITHRAQRIVSVATGWHVLVTCASNDSGLDQCKDIMPVADGTMPSKCRNNDSEASDIFITVSPQDTSS
ncbi:hypothetical protein L1049_013393 [Liquidambar formosana]|uniref:Uncharacterized protein n=1 Tax=Liquidambar formosana TaxID=63359 RepID=A0AAP0WU88_LIQFO